MLRLNQLQIDNLLAVQYTLDFVGDLLPKHTHEKNSEHITIVLKGSLLCDYGSHMKHLQAGDVYDHGENEQTHELRALEDNTVFLNITKNGKTTIDEIEPTPEQLEKHRLAAEDFQKKQEEFRQKQLDHIKRLEEEDRAKGIIV